MLLTLGFAALASTPVAAQRTAGDDPQFGGEGTTVSAPDRGYRVTAALTTLYDTNILRGNNNGNFDPDRQKGDFRLSPSVTGAYGLPIGRQQVFIGATLGRDFYVDNTYLDRNRYVVAGGANLRVGTSCSGTLTGEYQSRQSLLSDLSNATNNVQETQIYNATADCLPPVGVGFGGSVRRTMVDNDSEVRKPFDSRDTSYNAHLNFGSATLGRFSAGGSFSKIDYPNRFVLGADGQQSDGLNFFSGNVGYTRSVGARLNFTISGSYLKTVPQPRTVFQLVSVFGIPVGQVPVDRSSYSGGGYNLSVNYKPGARITLDIIAGRDVTSSPNVGALFTITNNYAVDLGYNLSSSLNAGIGGSYTERKYRSSFASVDEPQPRISDKNQRVYARVSYTPVKLYDVDFEVGHQRRNSNPSFYDFTSTTATLTLRVKFGRS